MKRLIFLAILLTPFSAFAVNEVIPTNISTSDACWYPDGKYEQSVSVPNSDTLVSDSFLKARNQVFFLTIYYPNMQIKNPTINLYAYHCSNKRIKKYGNLTGLKRKYIPASYQFPRLASGGQNSLFLDFNWSSASCVFQWEYCIPEYYQIQVNIDKRNTEIYSKTAKDGFKKIGTTKLSITFVSR